VRPNIPTLIIDPVMLFREGLRCILHNAGFQPVWCSDVPPLAPVPELSGQASPLLIVGTEVEEAMIQVAEVRRFYPMCRLVLMLQDISKERVIAAIRCGVRTVVCKGTSCEALIGTLKLVLDGATVLPSDALDALLDVQDVAPMTITRFSGAPRIETVEMSDVSPEQCAGLTAREMSALQWLRDGLPNKEIARRMDITEATVKVHVKAILRKTRTKNRTQVAMWASKLELMRQTASANRDTASASDLGDGPETLAQPFPLIGASIESLRAGASSKLTVGNQRLI
jgi:two-component system nitrate/nitrite response regulator NarL